MNIGLLGGTFNPPHNGHLAIAQQVLDYTDVDEVWFVPSYQHTFEKPISPALDRLTMTQLLVTARNAYEEKKSPLSVSTIEIDNKLDGNTINLLPLLPKEHEYRFIIGSDLLPTFHLWGEWKRLLSVLSFLVFPRYGYPNEPLYAGMTMVNDPAIIVSNISSTKIRERVRRGLSLEGFVPAAVSAYIMSHELYST